MNTEGIKVNECKTLVLHIDLTTDKVHRVDVHTPNSLVAQSINHEPSGIS